VYVAFIVGAGLFALATSINSTFSWATKSLLIACDDGWLPSRLASVNKRFNTPHILLTVILIFGLVPILAGKDLEYIILLGGGLVFIYDVIPLIAAFRFAKKMPDVFGNANMNISERKLKIISTIGILILIGQGSLSFSEGELSEVIYRIALVILYILFVLIYIKLRQPYIKKTDS
jgi:APA family basic amino acid/polyamine antiporter